MESSRACLHVLACPVLLPSFISAPAILSGLLCLSCVYRQQRQQHNMAKDRFRPKLITNYTSKGLVAQSERADDQIAPTAAAHTIDDLQRWALLTATIIEGAPRANEMQTGAYLREIRERRLTSSAIRQFQHNYSGAVV